MGGVTGYHWEPNANSGKPMLALLEKEVPFLSHKRDRSAEIEAAKKTGPKMLS